MVVAAEKPQALCLGERIQLGVGDQAYTVVVGLPGRDEFPIGGLFGGRCRSRQHGHDGWLTEDLADGGWRFPRVQQAEQVESRIHVQRQRRFVQGDRKARLAAAHAHQRAGGG